MKKQWIEWGVIAAIFGTLYITGYLKDAAALLQRGLLETRIFQPDIVEKDLKADYRFMLLNEAGERVPFENFKGKTVFLNFWATWCPPCIAEMPDIHNLYEEMDPSAVTFVMVSLDDDFEKAKAFKTRKEYSFPIYQLVTARPAVFQSQAIPTTYVISPEGKIAASRSGMAKYNTESFQEFLMGL
ncbi:TlpA family protein disulfide reductase [Reichenbachiella ulvae]|uniref:TlpA family protein disulfide reductase n=1 Tax=Reichenbachiella ulvae TaxID=2980104 RepID=A0ABT3CU42_9BACT|nr:TlpA disulfide reductase family protein [Reichenbachiella ulvae]MCV9387220.1 TlpA family protein disulfide reductase [Reichenbachiella ulvae]